MTMGERIRETRCMRLEYQCNIIHRLWYIYEKNQHCTFTLQRSQKPGTRASTRSIELITESYVSALARVEGTNDIPAK